MYIIYNCKYVAKPINISYSVLESVTTKAKKEKKRLMGRTSYTCILICIVSLNHSTTNRGYIIKINIEVCLRFKSNKIIMEL